MEFRGIQYTVLQTANPTGWKWTVSIDGKRAKTGTGFSRIGAIRRAEKVIEDHLKEQARKFAAKQRSRETACPSSAVFASQRQLPLTRRGACRGTGGCIAR